ncbi:hypothetical protein, partial [Salmonella sp. M127]|uniref:hypothetical protein n=1 Tax=Salmonella sp. M127 TaxID=3240286 RepID=UPI00352B38AA
MRRSGVRYGAATMATPPSQAAPIPADAKRIGSAQQAATPNAAAIPASVSVAVPIPLGGLGVWVTGDSLWRALSCPNICSDYR